ncbi:regulatory protein GemA [Klebsiella michiganensis]|uniref:gp16 family protein n=1 Tax=Klebsiella michiganensis TaxID=1134687 RepID=UPI003464838B
MDKPQLIRLIHVAKGKLKMDDDTYRVLLANTANGKVSCSKMTHAELTDVYSELQQRGFKRSFKKPQTRVKPNSQGAPRAEEISKIRAIWQVMFRHGFVKSDSELSLNAYVKRMTSQLNKGVGVDEVGWLDGWLAFKVLECLKQWHIRLMLESLQLRRIPKPVNAITGDDARDYDAIMNAFEESL